MPTASIKPAVPVCNLQSSCMASASDRANGVMIPEVVLSALHYIGSLIGPERTYALKNMLLFYKDQQEDRQLADQVSLPTVQMIWINLLKQGRAHP